MKMIFIKLINVLSKIKGKFLLSTYEHPLINFLIKKYKFNLYTNKKLLRIANKIKKPNEITNL